MKVPPAARIYLDNGATSWPKPPQVLQAITDFYSENGAAAHRGGSNRVAESDRILQDTRHSIAGLLNVEESKRIAFATNGTDALNLAIHGLVRPGQRVVTSVAEHNSVLRPLRFLADHQKVEVTYVDCDSAGRIDLEQMNEAITPKTRLVCVSWVSNVTGIVQPVNEIARICRERGVFLLIDAAQATGHLDIDLKSVDCDLLASSGHKGLLGPLGTGFLYVGPRVESELVPSRQGGTGSNSEDDRQPWGLPERLESGNPNVGGIAGLQAGIQFINSETIAQITLHTGQLGQRIRQAFAAQSGVTVYPPGEQATARPNAQTEIVSFNVDRIDPQTVASVLDSTFGIQVRAGLHCAPKMHRQLGTMDCGGTVRVSPGFFNTIDEIEVLVDAIGQIADSC